MTENLIDPSAFSELAEAVGSEFASELLATFLSETPNLLVELKDAVAAQDADGYRRAAHSIKSNAQTFGAGVLADQARDLELTGLPGGAASVQDLENTFAQTADALRGLVDE